MVADIWEQTSQEFYQDTVLLMYLRVLKRWDAHKYVPKPEGKQLGI